VAVAPPCFIGLSPSTRASITSAAGDVDRPKMAAQPTDLSSPPHQLLLALGSREF
jgi:hypothetical protein